MRIPKNETSFKLLKAGNNNTLYAYAVCLCCACGYFY